MLDFQTSPEVFGNPSTIHRKLSAVICTHQSEDLAENVLIDIFKGNRPLSIQPVGRSKGLNQLK